MSAEVLRNFERDGYRCVLMKISHDSSPVFSSDWGHNDYWYTCYVGVPETHPLAGLWTDEIHSLDVYGGVTYTDTQLQKVDDDGNMDRYWIGWDYNHAGDNCSNLEQPDLMNDIRDAVKQLKEVNK